MIRKILAILVISVFSINSVLAYTPNLKDKQIVEKVKLALSKIDKEKWREIKGRVDKAKKKVRGQDNRIAYLIKQIAIILSYREEKLMVEDDDFFEIKEEQNKIKEGLVKIPTRNGKKCEYRGLIENGKKVLYGNLCENWQDKLEVNVNKGEKYFCTIMEAKKEGWEFSETCSKNMYRMELEKEIRESEENGRVGGVKYYNPYDTSYLDMGFTCGKKRYCKYMDSCMEATFYWKKCGKKDFDRDEDGIPCENICGEEKIK